ncbi:glutamate--cysteine ligase [Nocardia sp. NPDC050193]
MNGPAIRNVAVPTIGVEEEFLLTNPETGAPAEKSTEVARTARDNGLDLPLELTRCQVEANTGIHSDPAQLLAELRDLRRTVASCAEKNGTRLLAVAAPPTGTGMASITETPRHRRIAAGFGMLAREQQLCGCHVHIGIPDRDTALHASNFLRPRLPLFLALTANSAIYRGVDTGYASWRHIMWGRWPSAGPPPYFASTTHYDAMVDMLLSTGIILDRKMVYWDVRPSVTYPTVEIRVSDIPATVQETALLATLVRATVTTALTSPRPAPHIPEALLRAAYWRAAHYGITGELVDPVNGRMIAGRNWLSDLISDIRPALEELGDYRFVTETTDEVLAYGNGAVRQRRALRAPHDIRGVLTELAEATLQGCL